MDESKERDETQYCNHSEVLPKETSEAIDKAIQALQSNPNITRQELTEMFPKETCIGVNPYTGNKVIVKDKDYSYFIHKHVREGSLNSTDMKMIAEIFDYDTLAIRKNDTGNIIGYSFIKESNEREGYYDAISKILGDREEVFHFQFRRIKEGERYIRQLKENDLIIIDKTLDI